MGHSAATRWAVVGATVAGLLGAACGGVGESVQGFRDQVATISLDDAMAGLRDCDALSERFVDLVGTAADAVDGLAESTDGRLPATEIREVVDKVAVARYFQIAEQLGCARLQMELDTIDLLRGVQPETPAGDDFLTEVLRELEQAG